MQPDTSGREWGIHQLDDPPHNRLLGPVFPRGGPCGLVTKDGQMLVQWGDIDRADMTFSVTKTYLALAAGVESHGDTYCILPVSGKAVVLMCLSR